jgi:hypothetical protein
LKVATVREYRATARAIVLDPERFDRDRNLALIELVRTISREDDPTVRRWARRAVWEESRAYFGYEDSPPDVPTDAYEHAQRIQRAKGYAVCPLCTSPLATDDDFERWRHLRADQIALLQAREDAVNA